MPRHLNRPNLFMILILFIFYSTPASFAQAATCGDTWEAVRRFNDLYSVAYGAGLYVAAGENSSAAILTSPDGTTWTRRPLTVTAELDGLTGVVWSGSQFVAVGHGNAILTSPNGITWTARALWTTQYLNAVTWNGSQFVAVGGWGGSTTILTSPNGVTWTPRPSDTTAPLSSVIWSGSRFVAVGPGGTILTSLDGVTWTSRPSGTTDSLWGVTWSGARFVAVGSNGKILTSPDGLAWTVHPLDTAQWLLSVAWSGSQFVATGPEGVILTSPDGITWTSRTSGTTASLSGLIWGGSRFVVVGSGEKILTSSDGVTWTSRNSGTISNISDVAWSGSQFAAVGADGAILTSPTGVTWTSRVSGITSNISGVVWSGSQFVAVGSGGKILTSPDGITWTSRTSGTTEKLEDITWNSSQFVVVGSNGKILTSPTGVAWTSRTSGTTAGLESVTWGGDRFVAVGSNGTILTSPDGITWTSRTSGTTEKLEGVTWGNNQFMAVGSDGAIMISTDGVSWSSVRNASPAESIPHLSGVTWDGARFVAVGSNGTILTSDNDGNTWNLQPTDTTKGLLGVVRGGNQWVAVGRGIILRSTPCLLTITKAGSTSGGFVRSEPERTLCRSATYEYGAVCSAIYPANTEVILYAEDGYDSTFTGWSGSGCSGVDSCIVTMDAVKAVTATFIPRLQISSSVSKAEGNTGTSAFIFTVTLSSASTNTVTVNYATADGTATAGTDYVAANGTLTFAPGQTSKTITVNVTGDATAEANETFYVSLSNPVGATIYYPSTGSGTILNDDGPVLKITDRSLAEGNTGTTAFAFTVTLSLASTSTVTVSYATDDDYYGGPGRATPGSDYTATSGTLTFAPGETSKTVTVNVTGDTTAEANETFYVNLSSEVGATIFDSQGLGTILNDDGSVLRINDVSKAEGSAGTNPFTFTVTLSPASTSTETVNYVTANSSAAAGSDYTAASGTLTFAPGETSKTVTVNVTGDLTVETNEAFYVNLSSTGSLLGGATIFDGVGIGTIINDDGSVLKITDRSLAEGNTGATAFTFTVTLSPASTSNVTVRYATANGTATAGSDYTAVPSTLLTFAPGETSKTFTVNVTGDTTAEANEAFYVNLSSAVGATIFDAQGLGTILNDDGPVLKITDRSLAEGNTGATAFTFTVSLSPTSTSNVTVRYATANGTAAAGSDYTAVPSTLLTFTPGQTSKTVTVNVTGDTAVEANETFAVNLSSAVGATLFDAQGVGMILNDD